MSNVGSEVDSENDVDLTPLDWKERGNLYYGNSDFEQAAEAYRKGLDLLQHKDIGGDEDITVGTSLKSNLAWVLIKLERYQQAEQVCTQILAVDSQNAKGELKRGLDLTFKFYSL